MKALIYLLPLLPTLIYLAYYIVLGRKRGLSRGEILVGIKNAPWVRLFLMTLFTVAMVIVFVALTTGQYRGDDFVPAHMEDGKFVKGKMDGR